jgi:RHS repeat-associated protein
VGNILQIADAAQPVRYHHNQRVVPANDYQYDALYQLTCATGRENAGAAAQGPGLPVPQVPLSVDPNAFSTYTRRYSYDRGANLLRIRHQGAQDYTLDMLVAPTSNRAVQQTGHLTPGDVDGHFDAAGNLLQLAPGQALRWDGRNQLQRVAQVLRHNALDDAETYQYDGAGQRLRKTTLSHTRGTVRSAQVLYLPGLELRVTQREQGGTSRTVEELHVISAGGAGRQQVRVLHWEAGQPADIPNDQLRGSLDNQIGSSLLELDQQAEILTLEEYFPFGGTAVWSGKTVSETKYKFVRYSGQERDASGLYYYGFRYYAPWLGRWLNPDPAGTVDGLNLYCMVGSNPITYLDVRGFAKASQELREAMVKKTIEIYGKVKNLNKSHMINMISANYNGEADADDVDYAVTKAIKRMTRGEVDKPPALKGASASAPIAAASARSAPPQHAAAAALAKHPDQLALDHVWATNVGTDHIKAGARGDDRSGIGSQVVRELEKRNEDIFHRNKDFRMNVKIWGNRPSIELANEFEERINMQSVPVKNRFRAMEDPGFEAMFKNKKLYAPGTFLATSAAVEGASFFMSAKSTMIEVSGMAANITNVYPGRSEREFVFSKAAVFQVEKLPSGRYHLKQHRP